MIKATRSDINWQAGGGTRTYTYTNTNDYPVFLNSVTVKLASGNGTVNNANGTVSPLSRARVITAASKDLALQQAIAYWSNASNWAWNELTGNGNSFNTTLSFTYGGNYYSVSKNISQKATARLGTRAIPSISGSNINIISLGGGDYSATLLTSAYATQGWGGYSGQAEQTYTFTNPAQINAGDSVTLTLDYRTGSSDIVPTYASGTGEPVASETQATQPTITSVTESLSKKLNNYVAGYSELTFTISAEDASSYEVYDGTTLVYQGEDNEGTIQTSQNSTGKFTYVAKSGSLTATTEGQQFTYVPYSKGQISIASILSQRCDSDGTLNDEGTYCLAKCTFTNSKLNNQDITTTITISVVGVSGSQSATASPVSKIVGGTLLTTNSYEIVYTLSDGIDTFAYVDNLSQARYLMDFVDNGVGIGTIAESGKLKIGDTDNELEIEINDMPMADFVVEQAISGIWTIRKWASGIAECYGIYAGTTGSEGSGSNINVVTNLPSGLFIANPVVNANVSFDAIPNGGYITYCQAEPTLIDTYFTKLSSYTNRPYKLHYQLIGRWK